MEKHIIVLGAINIDRIKAILEAAGFRICDHLSVETLRESLCLIISVSEFEKIDQIIERVKLQTTIPMVVVYQELSFNEKENLIQRGVGGFVQKDRIDSRLLEEIDFARIRNAYISKSKKTIEELEHKLDNRKLIDQAKGVLIDQGFSEKEAYQLMRKASMDQRVPLHKIAQAVLLHKKISEEGN